MRAVLIPSPGIVELVEMDAPAAGPGEVIVDIAFAGICASDVEVLTGRRPSEYVRYPVVPGHEWAGVVAAVGDGVASDLVGRKAVGEGFRSCATCASCLCGDSTLCSRYDETGFTAPGAWAQQLLLPVRLLHVLADDADLRSAAGLEPAACAADAVRRAGEVRGRRVAVVGAGTIGLLTVQLLRGRSPRELLVVEPDTRRAELARQCGATEGVAPDDVSCIGDSYDIVIEASGASATAQLAVTLARRGGRVVLTGMFDHDAVLKARDIVGKRLLVDSVFGAAHEAWIDALDAFGRGILDPGALVTHEFSLTEAHRAVDLVAGRDAHTGKVLLRP